MTSSRENVQLSDGVMGDGGSGGDEKIDQDAETVAQAMAQTEYSKDVLDKVTSYKVRPNSCRHRIGVLLL